MRGHMGGRTPGRQQQPLREVGNSWERNGQVGRAMPTELRNLTGGARWWARGVAEGRQVQVQLEGTASSSAAVQEVAAERPLSRSLEGGSKPGGRGS